MVARLRKVGRYGNAWVIKLKPSDVTDFELVDSKEYMCDIEDLIFKEVEDGTDLS